jgi:hypothetical protein
MGLGYPLGMGNKSDAIMLWQSLKLSHSLVIKQVSQHA